MIELRDAQFSDYKAIAKLHAESWRLHYRGIMSDNFLDNEIDKDRLDIWHQRLKFPTKNQHVTIAMMDGNIVGFSCLYLNDDPVFGSLVDNLHVLINLQKSGIGKSLMKECAKQVLQKAKSNKMYLWVFESNTNARKFYERLGGVHFETIYKKEFAEINAKSCRYIWDDVSVIISA